MRALAAGRHPGAEARYCESEIYADVGRVYEVEVALADGKACEAAATAAGALLCDECKLPVEAIDPRVKATVERVAPGGTIVELESKQAPNLAEVSVEVKVGDVEHYGRTTPASELLEHLLRVPAISEVPAP